MAKIRFWMSAATAVAVCLASAAPAMAASLPAPAYAGGPNSALGHAGWRVQDESVSHRRGSYRNRGYYGDYDRGRGSSAGDVIAGVLVLGGIAAIASAVSRDAQQRRYEDRTDRYRDPRARSNELNAAADSCAYAAETRLGGNARLGEITSVERDGNGWQVQGTVTSYDRNQGFMCGVTEGRIDYLQLDEAGY